MRGGGDPNRAAGRLRVRPETEKGGTARGAQRTGDRKNFPSARGFGSRSRSTFSPPTRRPPGTPVLTRWRSPVLLFFPDSAPALLRLRGGHTQLRFRRRIQCKQGSRPCDFRDRDREPVNNAGGARNAGAGRELTSRSDRAFGCAGRGRRDNAAFPLRAGEAGGRVSPYILFFCKRAAARLNAAAARNARAL